MLTADEIRDRLKAGDEDYLKIQERVLTYLKDHPKEIFVNSQVAKALEVDLVAVCVITHGLAKKNLILSVGAYTSMSDT